MERTETSNGPDLRACRPWGAGLGRLALCLSVIAGAPTPLAWAFQDGAVQTALDAPAPAADVDPAQPIGFNFKEAPYTEVLDFFSRESQLPLIKEAPVPGGTLTFISGETYSFDDALSILNQNLHMHNVHLRREGQYLYLATLKDSVRKPGEVFNVDAIPQGISADQIISVTFPLSNANAELVSDQLKDMISDFGAIKSVPAQNMLIIIDTRGQIDRMRGIIDAIDSQPPVDSEYKLFPLKHAEPAAVVEALKGLVGQRVQRIIIDPKGEQRVVEDIDVGGVSLQPDPRTGSVIAVGPKSRLQTVEELILLLDRPDELGGERQLMTFDLVSVTAEEAQRTLSGLFQSLPQDRRPTIIPLAEQSKISIVAPPALLAQATALIGEIDPGQDGQGRAAAAGRVTRSIELQRVEARQIEQMVGRLLTARQRAVVSYAVAPSGSRLLVSGPAADVQAFESLIQSLDTAEAGNIDVRVVTIGAADPAAALARARELDALTPQAAADPVQATLAEGSRELTLVGSPSALDRFMSRLRQVETGAQIERESRRYELAKAKPSQVAPALQRLAEPLLRPDDGAAYVAPEVVALDELGALVVRAQPGQFAAIAELLAQLDEPADAGQFRIVRIRRGDPQELADRARALYDEQTAPMDQPELAALTVTADADAGALIIRGSSVAMRLYTDIISQLEQLTPPQRTTRLLDLRYAEAQTVLEPLQELLASADPIDPGRAAPEPTLKVVEQTNSLMVTAEPAQHDLIASFVQRLDQIEPTDLPPLRLLQLRTADVTAIADMLRRQYDARPQSDRAARPVEIRADAATNTLIVSAHTELFDEIKTFVEDVNREQREGPERAPLLFPLKVAKAVDVAQAMNTLYPEPPIPRDRRGQPMPWLQERRQVNVSADPGSNSLIIDAPVEMHESITALAEQLDRVEAPPSSELKTYRVIGADLDAISRTLQGMSRQGILSKPAQPGKQPAQVIIETEPRSGTLIVAGDETTFARVEQMLQDLSAVPVEKQLRIVPIANADAAEVRDRARTIYDAQVAGIPDAGPVDITVDESSNALEIVADAESMDRFIDVLDELQRQAGPPRDVRLIQLQRANVTDVIDFLRELVAASESIQSQGGPDPVFEPIETTNSLLIAAQPIQFAIIEQLVRSLDNQQTADRPPLRILRLRTTDAANLASVLTQSYQQRPPEVRAKQPVDIQADPATNTLIVSAHPEVLPEIEAIVSDLNNARAMDEADRVIRIFPLTHAKAEDLAQTIDQMYPEPPIPIDPRTRQPRLDLRPPREVVVRADRATNALIVDAPANRLADFEQLVELLDKQELGGDVTLRTYTVARAELGAVAQTLRELSSSGALGASPRTPVTISTEPATRTLVVSGPADIFPRVEEVLRSVDDASAQAATSLKMYPLQHARADRIQPLLERLLRIQVRERQQRGELAPGDTESLLDVASERASNTLIISAPESILQIAEELLRTLDTEAAAIGSTVVRVVPLSFADAQQAARDLTAAVPGMDLPSGEDVRISAVSGANALLLSGAAADLEKLEALVGEIDTQPYDPEKPDVITLTLEHADADTVAPTVQRLLTEQQETDPRLLAIRLRELRNRPELLQTPKVTVEADDRTNSLVVSGPARTIELARAIVERLDQPTPDPDRRVLTYTPARADPTELARSVQRIIDQTMPQGRQALEVTPEPQSGAVLVIGAEDQVGRAAQLLAEFDDRAPAPPAADLAVLRLERADAAATAPTVQTMLTDRSRWPIELLRAERAGVPVPQPTVRAERESNRLVISAPTSLMPMARQLVETLDGAEAAAGPVDVRVFKLTKGDATGVASAVESALRAGTKPGDPPLSVSAERSSNAVVVAASPAQLQKAVELIESMDEAVEPAGVGVRTIYLKHARAETIAPVIEQALANETIVDLVPTWAILDIARNSPNLADPGVRVVAERRLNAIVVSAPLPMLELAEQMVTELDAAREGEAPRSVRIITLTSADAAELAQNLEAVFAEAPEGAEPPTIRVDVGSNSLIVRASAEQMTEIEALAGRLDSATLTTSRQMRMIPLDRSRVDAGLVADTLRRLIERQGGARVEVISVDELLRERKPDQPPQEPDPADEDADAAGPDIRAPHHGSPTSLLIGRMLAQVALGAQAEQPAAQRRTTQDGAPAQNEAPVTIAVDPDTNSLIVVGSPRLTERLAQLAEEIEQQAPAEPTRIRVVTLPQTADAAAIASIVQQTVQRVGQASARNPGGFTSQVVAMADPSGGALIVWANDTDFRTVGELIVSVSRLEATESQVIKIYPLSSITSQRAADAVRDLVSAQPTGRQARRLRAGGERTLDLTMLGPGGEVITAEVRPDLVRVMEDAAGASLIVAAPAETIPFIDAFVARIDQSPVQDRLSIRRYELKAADADDLSRWLERLLDAQRQGPGANDLPRARIVADARTNAIFVTASDDQHTDIERLLASADAEVGDDGLELLIIPIQNAEAQSVASVLEEVVIGRDPAKRDRIRISAERDSSLLIVRAPAEDLDEIRAIAGEVDRVGGPGLPIRSIKLQGADAPTVAQALQRLFDNRARQGGRRGRTEVSIIGDRRSGALVVSASDADFEQISELAATFDTPAASQDLRVEIIQLTSGRAKNVGDVIESLSQQLMNERLWGRRGGEQAPDERLYVETHEPSNSLLVIGQGATMDLALDVIKRLDQPASELTEKIVRAVPATGADLRSIERVIEQAFQEPSIGPWWFSSQGGGGISVEVDQRRGLVILVGERKRVEQAEVYVQQLAEAAGAADREIVSITLRHARADQAARNLSGFFDQRSRATGAPADVTIIGSRDGNVLIVSAPEDDLTIVRDLVAQIDQPESVEGERIEVFALGSMDPREAADTVRAMFPRGAGETVRVTPQPSTGSLIVMAREEQFEQIRILLEQLDSPRPVDRANIVTVQVEQGSPTDIAEILREAIPDTYQLKITPVERNRTIIISGGSDEAIEFAKQQIASLDIPKPDTMMELRRVPLKHAIATDVWVALREVLRNRPRDAAGPAPTVDYLAAENTLILTASSDDLPELLRMVEQLDVASESARTTEFIDLQFASAETVAQALGVFYGARASEAASPAARQVTIVPDPVTNSLIIAADEDLWPGIRGLLTQFDNERYATDQQLRVIPLKNADARNVAQALNDGFSAPIERQLQQERIRLQEQQRSRAQRDQFILEPPAVLIDAGDTPVVSAEVETNSLIVFASAKDLGRIEAIVEELDRPDFIKLPTAHIIPLTKGRATVIAEAARAVYQSSLRGGDPRSLLIYGDDASNTVIVRGDQAEFAQVAALVDTLQQEADSAAVKVHVLTLRNVPASRLRETLQRSFQARAQQLGQTLSVQVDRDSNALVIAASDALFTEMAEVARELDGAIPAEADPGAEQPGAGAVDATSALGRGVFIIDVEHNDPDQIRQMLEQLGVTGQQSADRPGLVGEPVTIVRMRSRRALAVLAARADGERITELVKALDAAPGDVTRTVRMVRLETAEAQQVVRTLTEMLNAGQASGAAPAAALAEQVRRLNMLTGDPARPELTLDLAEPIQIVADRQTNSVIVASSEANAAAVELLVETLDTLPVGDAVVVRFFPLVNSDAQRIRGVIDDLFQQGERLISIPGSGRRARSVTATGQALGGEIALSVDTRTNALIAAGAEDAIALVEVLVKDLDAADGQSWVEPVIVPLQHADAARLADTLRAVLVEGVRGDMGAEGMRQQLVRLRVAQEGRDPEGPNGRLESDVFTPMSTLIIRPEEELNALLIVGTAANIRAVTELANMLDVEGAAATNNVRIYPLQNASADRVASLVRDLFRDRERTGVSRPEDQVIVQPDTRTNALVVSTSPRSFTILENVIQSLDSAQARQTVGLHVIAVDEMDVRQLAPTIQNLMRDRIEASRRSGGIEGPEDIFTIEADPAGENLIVAASAENLQVVRDLIDSLARGQAPAVEPAGRGLVQIASMPASEMAETIQSLYVDPENERRGEGAVTVVPNDRLNAIIVAGSERDVQEIRRLVEQLDTAEVTYEQHMRRIQLRTANALEVVNLLETVLAGRPVSGADPSRARLATVVKFYRPQIEDAV
ncbi:MAG: secretin N-terminal domain-containing protein, partial [Phycisphaerales bacterium JB039]